MKKAICILIILFFAPMVWGAEKKGIVQKGIQKTAEIEEKETIVKTIEQKAKRALTRVDNARVKRLTK